MPKRILVGLATLLCAVFISGIAQADEPSLQQVYQATATGKLKQAQAMMGVVLQAHPNSGKAHFVESELLAKQGLLAQAKAELTTAERLSPGLAFAKPQSVQELQERVNAGQSALPAHARSATAGLPTEMLLVGLALIAFIAFAVRLMTRRSQVPVPVGGSQTGYASGNMPSPYGATPPSQSFTNAGVGQQPGLGSQVMGGLATGAAVGAGVVAGEALMHHFIGGSPATGPAFPADEWERAAPTADFDDLGGADFGITDTSSWDDSSSGSDWN